LNRWCAVIDLFSGNIACSTRVVTNGELLVIERRTSSDMGAIGQDVQ
jgi:hypothetical protein